MTKEVALTEWLLEQIAEDERVAREVPPLQPWDRPYGMRFLSWESDHSEADTAFVNAWDPARALAECEAKRRIVELSWHHLGDDDYAWGMEEAKRQIVAVLALPYADRPGYRDEWKP